MIKLHADGNASGPRFEVTTFSVGYVGESLPVYPLFVSTSDHQPGPVIEIQAGSIRTSARAYGLLRDKGVEHTNISGDLYVVMPTAESPRPYRALVDWGQPYSDVTQMRWIDQWYDGSCYTRIIACEHECRWYGDYLLTVTYGTTVVCTINGSFQTSEIGRVFTQLAAYRRCGNGVMSWLSSQNSWVRLPDDDVETFRTTAFSCGDHYMTPACNVVVPPLSGEDFSSIANGIEDYIRTYPGWAHLIQGQEPVDYGELALECAEQLHYVDSNVLLLAIDVNDWMHLHNLVKSVTNLPGWKRAYRVLKRIGRAGSTVTFEDFFDVLRPTASFYLFDKYGVQTMISDLGRLKKGMVKFLDQNRLQRLHSRRVVMLAPGSALFRRFTAILTVETDSLPIDPASSLQWAIGEAKNWGAYPSLSNLYDMLPYSFVVDWFVGYGDMVKQCDAYLDTENYFSLHHAVASSKWEAGYSSAEVLPGSPVIGDIVYSHYTRWIMEELPLPPVNLPQGSGAINHGVESLALILQRAGK